MKALQSKPGGPFGTFKGFIGHGWMRWPPTEGSRARAVSVKSVEREERWRGENETTIARTVGKRKLRGRGWFGVGREKSKSVVGDY